MSELVFVSLIVLLWILQLPSNSRGEMTIYPIKNQKFTILLLEDLSKILGYSENRK